MSILGKLLTLPLMGPINSVSWLGETLLGQVEAQLYNEDAVRGKLLELELRYDMGELDEEDFLTAEDELLAQLKLIRAYHAAQRGS